MDNFESDSEKEKLRRYDDTLSQYQNHSQNDYNDMIFESWKKNDKLFDTAGPIVYSKKILILVVFRKFLFWTLAVAAFAAPIILTIYLAKPVPNA